MLRLSRPSYSRKLSLEALEGEAISFLFYGEEIEEERAHAIAEALEHPGRTRLCRLESVDDAILRVAELDLQFNMFEEDELASLTGRLSGTVAVDLTSLEHRVWAPLIRAMIQAEVDVVALYAEPDDYRRSSDLPGTVYDLSTSRGIEPLPGFARIGRRSDEDGYFAPLLGFEGARLKHIFDQEEVEVRLTSPIIGVPGFRIEYPTYTYLGNQDVLEIDRMDQRVEFAKASCPFEAYEAIERIHAKTGGKHLRVAPIGTKPHALGAVLYAIRHPQTVELIYDHPVRSRGRTRGSRGVYVYDVASYWAKGDEGDS